MMIDVISERYSLVGRASIYHVPVDDPLTAALADAVRRFRDLLSARDELDGEWGIVSGRAMAAARALWTTPLPAIDPVLGLAGARDFLARRTPVAAQVHGDDIAAALADAVDGLTQVIDRAQSPFRESVVGELRASPSRLLVIRRASSVEPVQASMASIDLPVRVLTPAMLRDAAPVELVCVVGATRHFTPSLLTAPQGSRVAFVHPDWMHDLSETMGIFGSEADLAVRVRWQPTPFRGRQLDDLEHEPDWEAIARLGPAEAGWADIVPARLIIVSGPRRVFLESDAEAEVLVVEPGARQGSRVRREPTRRLAVGDYVLLREGYGTDDTRRIMADHILGPDARRLREAQASWKTGLRTAVDRYGLTRVDDDLAGRGVQARNLRYWIAPESIRPARFTDLEIALEYVGQKDRAEALWKDMERIARAHLQAGQKLRQMLEEEIERSDMSALAASGELTVRLDVDGGGSLGVYRVEEISPNLTEVPTAWLRVAQRIEGDLWQG